MHVDLFEFLLSTEGPSFLLQISQLHPEIVSSKTSILRNLSWSTAWVWVLLQSPVWFQIYALFFFAGSVCMELHFPDSLALRLSGSFSQCEAPEGDWGTEEGEDSIFLLLSLHFWGHIGQWLHLLLAAAPTRMAHWGSKICQATLTSCHVPPAPGMGEASYCCCSLDYSICALDYSTLLSHVLRIPAIKFPLLNILYLECFVGTWLITILLGKKGTLFSGCRAGGSDFYLSPTDHPFNKG